MALVFSQAGMEFLGELQTNNAVPDDLRIKLFQNDFTPDSTTVAADYTEATFSGYAEAILTPANWDVTLASTTVNLYNTAVVFESDTGSQDEDIYGYYIVRDTDGVLLWSERFDGAPDNIVNLGDRINVTPRFTLTNSGS